MKKLKICFAGIGSIARRHIKNMTNICGERNIELQIDAVRRKESVATDVDNLITNIYYTIQDIPSDYDVAFITNPTEYHLETIKAFKGKTKHFFIEKPLVTTGQLDRVNEINIENGSVYYVACPLRYNAVIQYLKQNINTNSVLSVRSISSSYLPEWRPGTDYRNTYSAHKNLGGGVAIDLIHEWDYLSFLFGIPQKIYCLTGKISDLEIDSEDYAIYIAKYKDKIAELHLDYFGRKNIREIQIFSKEDTIIGDIANCKINFQKSGKNIEFNEERDDFQKRELIHFLDILDRNVESDSDIDNAIQVLKMTKGVI